MCEGWWEDAKGVMGGAREERSAAEPRLPVLGAHAVDLGVCLKQSRLGRLGHTYVRLHLCVYTGTDAHAEQDRPRRLTTRACHRRSWRETGGGRNGGRSGTGGVWLQTGEIVAFPLH